LKKNILVYSNPENPEIRPGTGLIAVAGEWCMVPAPDTGAIILHRLIN